MSVTTQNTNPNSTVGEEVIETTNFVDVEILVDENQNNNLGDTDMTTAIDAMGLTPLENSDNESVNNDNEIVLLPIEKLTQNIEKFKLSENETKMRNDILDDLERAEFYTIASLYHYIKIGKKLIIIKEKLKGRKNRYTQFIASIGMNERTAQRYSKIASDNRFVSMTENEVKRLYHINQSKMIQMTKFSDDDFKKAIEDEDYVFPTKKISSPSMGTDIVIDKELYKTFLEKPKAFIINEYNHLLIEFNKLNNTVEVECVSREVA